MDHQKDEKKTILFKEYESPPGDSYKAMCTYEGMCTCKENYIVK